MRRLNAQVHWLTASVGANGYLLDAGDAVCLVDPGMRWGLNPVARSLVAAGRSPYQVTDILLTHYDYDHTQAAAEWQRRTGARVWLGAADAAILTGAARPTTAFRRLVAATGLPELPRGLRLIQADAEILPGVRAIPTPGHTPGHVVYVGGDAAFVGDAALVSRRGRLLPVPPLLDNDPRLARTTRERLAGLPATWLCCGHSAPARRT